MKLLARYLRPFYGSMLIGLIIKIMGTLVELVIPYILSHIVDNVVPTGELKAILFWGAMMLGCALLAMIFNIVANRMASRVAREGARAIRHDLFESTMRLSGRQTDHFTVPPFILFMLFSFLRFAITDFDILTKLVFESFSESS